MEIASKLIQLLLEYYETCPLAKMQLFCVDSVQQSLTPVLLYCLVRLAGPTEFGHELCNYEMYKHVLIQPRALTWFPMYLFCKS